MPQILKNDVCGDPVRGILEIVLNEVDLNVMITSSVSKELKK